MNRANEYVQRVRRKLRRRDRIEHAAVLLIAGTVCAAIGYLAAPLVLALIGVAP